jgi:predicted transcriptional regulator
VFMREVNRGYKEKIVQVLLVFSRGAKSRRCIMASLLFKPKNCNQIAEELGVDWWSVQKHLQRLLGEKLVERFDVGQIKFYTVSAKGEEALRSLSKNKK